MASRWTRRARPTSPESPSQPDFPTQNAFDATLDGDLRRVRDEAERGRLTPSSTPPSSAAAATECGARHRGGRVGRGLRHGIHHLERLPDPERLRCDVQRLHRRVRDEAERGRATRSSTPPSWAAATMSAASGSRWTGRARPTSRDTSDRSTSRPRTPSMRRSTAAIDAFVTKLSADGAALVYSTFLGGSGTERFG